MVEYRLDNGDIISITIAPKPPVRLTVGSVSRRELYQARQLGRGGLRVSVGIILLVVL